MMMQQPSHFDQSYIDQHRQAGFRPVAVLCCVHAKKILFVYKQEHALWQIPQGGIQPGETIAQAAKRELAEELGQSVADNVSPEIQVWGESRMVFPSHTQNSRRLVTEDGTDIAMKGKYYFFCSIQVTDPTIVLENTEFDDYGWFNYLAALGKANQIYQSGKRRITQQLLLLLKQHEVIA